MNQTPKRHALAAATLIVLLAAGQAAAQKTVKIAALLPLTGTSAEIGKDMRDAAALAIKERQDEFRSLGFTVELQTFDDAGQPLEGVRQAELILADASILGVIGAQASGVSLKAGEVLARGPVAMVSPTSTADELTSKGWPHFFRVVAPNQAQASASADYITETLKPKSIYFVTENTTYGNGLTRDVQALLNDSSVEILGYAGASDDQTYRAIAKKIALAKPDAVFFGGIGEKGGKFLKQLRAEGVTSTFMGGTSLDQPDFYAIAGADAEGAIFTTGFGANAAFEHRGKYKSFMPNFKRELQVRALFTYDATNVLLDAVGLAARSGGATPSRAQVLSALGKTTMSNSKSITGSSSSSGVSISFTPNGERQNAPVFIMKVGSNLQPQPVRTQLYKAK